MCGRSKMIEILLFQVHSTYISTITAFSMSNVGLLVISCHLIGVSVLGVILERMIMLQPYFELNKSNKKRYMSYIERCIFVKTQWWACIQKQLRGSIGNSRKCNQEANLRIGNKIFWTLMISAHYSIGYLQIHYNHYLTKHVDAILRTVVGSMKWWVLVNLPLYSLLRSC